MDTVITGLPASERKYLPTLADLIDRLSIVLLKSVFIPENREAYRDEIALIEHDIDLMMTRRFSAVELRAIMTNMLANHYIWVNESKARLAEGNEQDKLLRLTHSINGVRNTAKNVIAQRMGDRVDLKVDCLAADAPFGNWNIFEDQVDRAKAKA